MRVAEHGSFRPLAVFAALATLLVTATAVVAPPGEATAQEVRITAELRPVLQRYGRWERHPRWGEIWIPAHRTATWRPYQVGHWVYTDEWGWYWVSNEEEADWGWVTYHYGRWVFERPVGWIWIPGDEWAPAWVDWRRGSDYIGWAPLPPDDVIVTVRDNPDYWLFVRPRDLVAPRLTMVIVPPAQRGGIFQSTVVVNRTVVIRDRGPTVVVNPGIPPAYIAAAVGRPIRPVEVKPHVVIGTRGVSGAVEVRIGVGKPAPRIRETVVVKQTTVIQPAQTVPPPRPLGGNERGRLGDRPPRAAQGAAHPGPTAPVGERQQPAPPAAAAPAAPPQPPADAQRPAPPAAAAPAAPPQPPADAQRPAPPAAAAPAAPPQPPADAQQPGPPATAAPSTSPQPPAGAQRPGPPATAAPATSPRPPAGAQRPGPPATAAPATSPAPAQQMPRQRQRRSGDHPEPRRP